MYVCFPPEPLSSRPPPSWPRTAQRPHQHSPQPHTLHANSLLFSVNHEHEDQSEPCIRKCNPVPQKQLTADEVGVEDGVKLAPCGSQHVGGMQCIGQVLCLHAHADQHVVCARIRKLPWQHLGKPRISFYLLHLCKRPWEALQCMRGQCNLSEAVWSRAGLPERSA